MILVPNPNGRNSCFIWISPSGLIHRSGLNSLASGPQIFSSKCIALKKYNKMLTNMKMGVPNQLPKELGHLLNS